MEIALPLVTLASLIIAAVFFVRERTVSQQLAETKPKLTGLEGELREAQQSAQQRLQKDKNRGGELEELREKQKELRRQLNETQDQAKKLKAQEDMRREAENEARQQASQSHAEAVEAGHQLRVVRAELELLKSRRPVRPAPPAEPARTAVAPPTPAPAAPNAELLALEAKVHELQSHTADLDGKAKAADRKAHEAVREQERMKAKISTSDKLYIVQRGELELWKDRYRTLEQRLNKTLRETDALHRGVLALERRLPQAKVEEARAEAQAQAERAAAERAAAEEEAKARTAAAQEAALEPARSSESGQRSGEEPSLPEPSPDVNATSAKAEAAGREDEAAGIPPPPSEAVPEV